MNKPNGSIEFRSEVVLTCEVYGLDYALRWYKDGEDSEILEADKNIFRATGKLQRVLTVKNYNKRNDGVYKCRAERSVVKWSAQDEVHLVMRSE